MEQLSTAEAILFFDDLKIVKEMTFLEFQAILDSYVPLNDMANRSVGAVYVRVNAKYHATATVFFRINFDREGFVETAWNMPLQHLADKAAKGPNMGSGLVSLACFSQCPIADQKDNLWDPQMQAANNDFITIKKCLQVNNLGLVFNAVHKASVDQSESMYEERTRTAMMIKEQRLRQKLFAAKADQDLRQLNLDHQESTYNYKKKCDELELALKNERHKRTQLENKSKGQLDKIAGMREYFNAKLKQYQQNKDYQSDALREDYDAQFQVESAKLAKRHVAALEAQDVELIHRRGQETQLQREIIKLKREKQELAESSRVNVFYQLDDAGINFVTYHLGVGHLTLEVNEIDVYLSNNMAFAATKCGVSEAHYQAWLNHYYNPSCEKQLDNGRLCDTPLVRLDSPSQFVMGVSSCCDEHRYAVTRVVPIKSVPNSGFNNAFNNNFDSTSEDSANKSVNEGSSKPTSSSTKSGSRNKNGPTGLAL
ncbi:MAG: hypothetical protein ACJAUP_002845 [Cellvibrionaceae bacterium]|jgi:hypothetical protein